MVELLWMVQKLLQKNEGESEAEINLCNKKTVR